MSQLVHHQEDALIITIPTADPAHLHRQLMKAINTALKNHLVSPIDDKQEAADMVALSELLSCLLPTERQLLNLHGKPAS